VIKIIAGSGIRNDWGGIVDNSLQVNYNHYQYGKGDEREKSPFCPQGESAATESAFGLTVR